jgi:hypothetical protein
LLPIGNAKRFSTTHLRPQNKPPREDRGLALDLDQPEDYEQALQLNSRGG